MGQAFRFSPKSPAPAPYLPYLAQQVWKLESRAVACSSIPSIPSIPVSTGARGWACERTHTHTHACTREDLGLEGMEGMEEALSMRFSGFHTSAVGVEQVWKVWQ